MNWEMLGALGEIVGAAGVIGTLLYLARQIRSSSKEAQRARYNELASHVASVAQQWSQSDALNDVMFRGLRDPSSLQPDETFRFYSSIYGAMKAWEAAYQYSLEDGVHEWGADGLLATLSSFMALPGMQSYWENRRSWYSPSFQAEVDRVITAGAVRMDEAYGVGETRARRGTA